MLHFYDVQLGFVFLIHASADNFFDSGFGLQIVESVERGMGGINKYTKLLSNNNPPL